ASTVPLGTVGQRAGARSPKPARPARCRSWKNEPDRDPVSGREAGDALAGRVFVSPMAKSTSRTTIPALGGGPELEWLCGSDVLWIRFLWTAMNVF
ncbi:MAG: hypothetical protein ACK58T_24770, partial [Phycisphaerae bacterium]